MKFRIGAGTLITVLIALVIGGYGLYQQRRSATQPPVVERVVQGNTPHGVAPVPEFLIRHRTELALSDTQVQRLSLYSAWSNALQGANLAVPIGPDKRSCTASSARLMFEISTSYFLSTFPSSRNIL